MNKFFWICLNVSRKASNRDEIINILENDLDYLPMLDCRFEIKRVVTDK